MSAGYIIYSLDSEKFRAFTEQPTTAQLTAVGKLLSAGLKWLADEFEKGDPVLKWKTDLKSLAQTASERLALPDWYGDLSTMGKELWEGVIFDAFMHCKAIDVGFRCECDGIYWDVIEIAWKKLGVPPGTINETALSAFGTRPHRFNPPPTPAQAPVSQKDRKELVAELEAFSKSLDQMKQDILQGRKGLDDLLTEFQGSGLGNLLLDQPGEDFDIWTPMHSMHTADETRLMLDELKSIEPALKASKKKGVRQQYEDDLLPALQRVATDRRMLFVQVGT